MFDLSNPLSIQNIMHLYILKYLSKIYLTLNFIYEIQKLLCLYNDFYYIFE